MRSSAFNAPQDMGCGSKAKGEFYEENTLGYYGGCVCDFVAIVCIRVVVETLRSLEIEGEREYLERQNADAAGEVDSHPAQRR